MYRTPTLTALDELVESFNPTRLYKLRYEPSVAYYDWEETLNKIKNLIEMWLNNGGLGGVGTHLVFKGPPYPLEDDFNNVVRAETLLRDTNSKRYHTVFRGNIVNILYNQEENIRQLLIVEKDTIDLTLAFANLFV